MQATMDKPVPVRLTDEQVLSKAQELAAKVRYVRVLRRERREKLREANARIEAELDQIEVLAESIDAQQEIRKQGQLKFGEEAVMGKSEAQEALANVEKHASAEDELPPGAPALADEPAEPEEPKPEGEDPQPEAVEAGDDDEPDDDELDDEDEEDDDEPGPARRSADAAPAPAQARAARMGAGARTRSAGGGPGARGPIQRASGRKTPSRGKGKGRR